MLAKPHFYIVSASNPNGKNRIKKVKMRFLIFYIILTPSTDQSITLQFISSFVCYVSNKASTVARTTFTECSSQL